MKKLNQFINDGFPRFSQHFEAISSVIGEAFEYATDKEGAEEVLTAIEEAIADAAVHLELHEKKDALKALENWAKKHKFNL